MNRHRTHSDTHLLSLTKYVCDISSDEFNKCRTEKNQPTEDTLFFVYPMEECQVFLFINWINGLLN